MQNICSIKNLYFNVSGKSLFTRLNLELPAGLVGLVGDNGCGKSTLLQLLTGQIKPERGNITWHRDHFAVDQAERLCGQRIVDIFDPMGLYDSFARIQSGIYCEEDLTRVADAWTLPTVWQQHLLSAGINLALDTPIADLSGGERKRLTLINAFSRKDHYLLLDEPSNHLDSSSRDWLHRKILDHRAGALIVSHDRDVLQRVDTILELKRGKIQAYGGNYAHYHTLKNRQNQSIEKEIDSTKKRINALNKLKQNAEEKSANRRNQGKKLQGSQCKVLLDAKKDRAGQSLGKLTRNLDRQHNKLKQTLRNAQKDYKEHKPLSIHLNKAGLTGGIRLHLEALRLPYGHQTGPISLTMYSGQRWQICGANGSGKSTLLKIIAGQLKPAGGLCRTSGSCFYLDQHLSQFDEKLSALENLSLLHPDKETKHWRTALATLKLRGDSALQPIKTLSGGERLKVALLAATRGTRAADLLLLDEPDNHLDLESRIALEAALIDYPGTFLLVSHDSTFVEQVGIDRKIYL
ncbi:ATP-binding cassette domain-containing protein [Microbulbifer sp. SSSA002]|uniref:ATP-binding cassette domain-containing protein n=1 Tax=Microbulbifer sp. SSSA002 TaxID=3243376 RepID=UPI004039D706